MLVTLYISSKKNKKPSRATHGALTQARTPNGHLVSTCSRSWLRRCRRSNHDRSGMEAMCACTGSRCAAILRLATLSSNPPLPRRFAFSLWYIHGMSLQQTIRTDMTSAMKARDSLRVDTLRGALTAFTNEVVAKGKKPTEEIADNDAVTVLKRLGKQRKDAIEQYTAGGRTELAEKEASELKIIEAYLPQMASREEIDKVARAKKEELRVVDASGAGKLTGAVMKEFAGRADGTDVKEVVAALF